MMIRIIIALLFVFSLSNCSKDCGDANKLISMRIEGIVLKSFPNTKPDGSQWDESVIVTEFPADPIITISSGIDIIAETEIYMPNIVSPFEAIYNAWFTIEKMNQSITLSVWDKDELENEFIASVSGIPKEMFEESGCNSTYLFSTEECEIEIEVSYKVED